MSYINKPKVAHPSLPTNTLGMTRRQYEGSMSTLCAGCGHDSGTASIIEACWGLSLRPEQLVELAAIGCSAKTTAYCVGGSHGLNSVHGRMPSIASGANAANRRLTYVGVSGDGDSLSIGIGQLVHAIRRNVNMLYLIENNGVYGLTKGQFSASADIGTQAKRGGVNWSPPIHPGLPALALCPTFVRPRSHHEERGGQHGVHNPHPPPRRAAEPHSVRKPPPGPRGAQKAHGPLSVRRRGVASRQWPSGPVAKEADFLA